MNKTLALENFHKLVERDGLIKSVRAILGDGVIVRLPFASVVYDRPIEDLSLSTRSYNCLCRNGIVKIDHLLTNLQRDDFSKMRNLGVKSLNEIKNKVIDYGYKNLSKGEQIKFLSGLIEDNCE